MHTISPAHTNANLHTTTCAGPLPKSDSVQSLVSLINCPPNPTAASNLDDVTIRAQDSNGHSHTVVITDDTDFVSLSGLALTIIDLCALNTSLHTSALREISLAANALEIVDLAPLAACPSLSVVSLNSNRISSLDLTPLASCRKLERLWLHDNRLETIDLTPLKHCKCLRSLYLEDNSLHSETLNLSPLASTLKLRSLRLGGNKLGSQLDLTPLLQCPALAVFNIDSSIQLHAEGESSQARVSSALRRIVLDIKFSGVPVADNPRPKGRTTAPVSPKGGSSPTRTRRKVVSPPRVIGYTSPPKPDTPIRATKPPPCSPIVKVLLVGFRRLARYAAEDSFAKCGKIMIRASTQDVATTEPTLLLDSHLILLYAPSENTLRQVTVVVGRIPTVVLGTERYRSTAHNQMLDLLDRFNFYADPMDAEDTKAVYTMGSEYATGTKKAPAGAIMESKSLSSSDSSSPVSEEDEGERNDGKAKTSIRKSYSESSLLTVNNNASIEMEDIEDDENERPNKSRETENGRHQILRSLSADGILGDLSVCPEVMHRPALTWSEVTRRLKERRGRKVGRGWGGYIGSEMSLHGKNKLRAERAAVEVAFSDLGGYATVDTCSGIARSCGLPKCAGPLLFKAAFGSSFETESTTPEAGVPTAPLERMQRRMCSDTFVSYWDARLKAFDGEERLCNILEDSYSSSISSQGANCGHSPYGAPLSRRSSSSGSVTGLTLDLGPSASFSSFSNPNDSIGSLGFGALKRHGSSFSQLSLDLSCPCDAGIESLITAFMEGRSSRFGSFALVKMSEAIAIGSALVMYGLRGWNNNPVGGRARPVCPKEVRGCKLNAALIAAEVGIFEGVASGLSMDQIRSVKGCYATEACPSEVSRSGGIALNYCLSLEEVQRFCISRKSLLPGAVERVMATHCRDPQQMNLSEFAVFLSVLNNASSNGAVDYFFTVVDTDQDERWTLPDLKHFHMEKERLWLDDGMAMCDLVDIWVNLIDMIRPAKPSRGISRREFRSLAAKERKQVIHSLLFVDDDHSLLNIRRTMELSKQSSPAVVVM